MCCRGASCLPHIKGVTSYELIPAQNYLIATSDNQRLQGLHSQLVKIYPKQHKRDDGQDFLGASADINQAWIVFVVQDAQGQVVYSNGKISAQSTVDDNAYIYRLRTIDKSGQLVRRHDLFNIVSGSSKRLIPTRKSDTTTFKIYVEPWAKSPLTIVATLKYRKLNNQYALGITR
jgi:hypothetical protein